VLKDLGKSNTKEARIILGAAVADDVIGLVVLAVVSGLVAAATANPAPLASVGPALCGLLRSRPCFS